MATVTFPIELGGSGLVVSDDTDPTTGLRNGGYLTRFVPALQQTVAVAGFVVTQANNAANSATSAGDSATSAGNSAASSANSAASAATLYDQFDDRVLGPKAANPTLDNDGNALLVGAIYFNTTAMETRVWNGTTWQSASVNGGTVNSLTVTGAFEYQGTFTGGAGVMNIGEGQIFKDASGNVVLGGTANPSGYKFKVSSGGAEIFFAVNQKIEFLSTNSGGTGIRLFSRTDAGELSPLELQGSSVVFPLSTGNAGLVFNALSGNLLISRVTDTGHSLSIGANSNGLRALSIAGTPSPQGGASYFLLGNSDASGAAGPCIIQSANRALIFGLGTSFTGDGGTFSESMRITSSRYLKASNTGTYQNIAGTGHDFETSVGNALSAYNSDLGGGANVITSVGVGAFTGRLYVGVNNGAVNYQVNSDGSLQNATNSYGALSDPKLKDIIGTKGSTWEKTKQYNWIEYYLKSDVNHEFKLLGLNAAEAALVSPGVIDSRPDFIEVQKVRQVPVQIVRLDENESPVVDEETGEVIYDEVMVDEEYTEWEPNGEFTKSVKYSVVSMQYHRTTQECQQRIEDLETAKVQADDLIQQIMARVAALESASA